MDGWMEVKAVLSIAYSNQKQEKIYPNSKQLIKHEIDKLRPKSVLALWTLIWGYLCDIANSTDKNGRFQKAATKELKFKDFVLSKIIPGPLTLFYIQRMLKFVITIL